MAVSMVTKVSTTGPTDRKTVGTDLGEALKTCAEISSTVEQICDLINGPSPAPDEDRDAEPPPGISMKASTLSDVLRSIAQRLCDIRGSL